MIFKVEAYDKKKHYHMLEQWWNEQNFPPPPAYLLPVGILVYSEAAKDYIYAGFLYTTDMKFIAWMEFVVSNPRFNRVPDLRRGGLEELVDAMGFLAKKLTKKKCTMLFTSTNNPAFVNSLKKSNFEVGDKDTYQLIKYI